MAELDVPKSMAQNTVRSLRAGGRRWEGGGAILLMQTLPRRPATPPVTAPGSLQPDLRDELGVQVCLDSFRAAFGAVA